MAQLLSVLSALLEDLILILSTHIRGLTTTYSPATVIFSFNSEKLKMNLKKE